MWLKEPDPFDNHPFSTDSNARLPERVEVVVIGAGMVGSAAAYHWSKLAHASMLVLEKDGVASGSAGRNEGLVVMERDHDYVHHTVSAYLTRARHDLVHAESDRLAHEYAAAYCRAAYANGEMIAKTIQNEGIDCHYVRKGWVQASGPERLDQLDASMRMELKCFTDWTKITKGETFDRAGLRSETPSGFSIGAASWHPAKWVWGLMRIALESPHLLLFTRTKSAWRTAAKNMPCIPIGELCSHGMSSMQPSLHAATVSGLSQRDSPHADASCVGYIRCRLDEERRRDQQ